MRRLVHTYSLYKIPAQKMAREAYKPMDKNTVSPFCYGFAAQAPFICKVLACFPVAGF
jgi:hypothetical protein